MSPTIKKLTMTIGFLLIVFVIGFALYSVFKKTELGGPTVVTPGGGGTKDQGAFPGSGTRTTTGQSGNVDGGTLPIGTVITSPINENYFRPDLVKKVMDDKPYFPSITNSGFLRYHNVEDGKFYSVGSNGQVRQLADQVFYNVKNVTWAKNVNKAVIEYPDSTKIIYNFDTKTQVTLPKHWEDFSFSPDGGEVAAKSIGLSPENRWLVTTKDDGTGIQLIEPLGNNSDKVIMNWSPSRQTVAFSMTGEPQGADRREVLLVGLNGENLKSLVVEGLDFEAQWSPSGKKLLYSVDSARSEFKPELWIVNSYGESIGTGRQMLGLYTWAEKCTFADDNTAICGVPRYLPEGAGMSPGIAADIPDDLYKIDIKSGIKTPIKLGRDYTISSISYDPVGKKIIFTDNHLTGAFEVSI